MTWGQPPYYVHAMVHDTWLPWAVNITGPVSNINQLASAATSADGTQLVVRLVNIEGPQVCGCGCA